MAKTLITSGQEKQYKRFVEDAANKALARVGLDKDGIQRLIMKGDEFQTCIIAGIRDLSMGNQYADEEVESAYGYLSGYKPKPIAEQMKILRELFSELGSVDENLAKVTLPPNAEGWFAIPRWEKIASTPDEAVEKVLDLIKQTRGGNFHNYREGKLRPQYFRQHAKTAEMFRAIGEEQKGHDILVVPAQFGLLHRGKSVRRAREVMNASEFGLGAFAIGIMILTHPERLQGYNDLWIDCPGDEYAPGADGDFSHAPCFIFCVGRVEFDAGRIDDPDDDFGSVSGFVPQS